MEDMQRGALKEAIRFVDQAIETVKRITAEETDKHRKLPDALQQAGKRQEDE